MAEELYYILMSREKMLKMMLMRSLPTGFICFEDDEMLYIIMIIVKELNG